jgi:hypothetical protein
MVGYGGEYGAGWGGNRGSWGNRDYDRNFGQRRGGLFGGGRTRDDASWTGRATGGYDSGYGADRGWGRGNVAGYDRTYGYDRGFFSGRGGYDRNYKSDYQTRHGDPFGDRARGTPIYVMDGSYKDQMRNRGRGRAGYDRDMYGGGGYDRDTYRTSSGRGGYDRGGYRTDAGRGRYDSWWW